MKTTPKDFDRAQLKQDIRTNVIYFRKARKLSEKELAKKAGVSVLTILHIEDKDNESLPHLKTLLKLSKALNLHVSTLFYVPGLQPGRK